MSTNISPIVNCKNVSKSFVNFIALKKVNLSIYSGDKIGLVGANGSGKSTLLKIIAGLMKEDTGTITIGSKASVGYLPQELTAWENVTTNEFLQTTVELPESELRIKVLPVLNKLHLDESLLTKKIKDLSGGEKTKIAIARILLSDYDLFLLDEPTNNIDLEALIFLEEFIKKSNKAFLIVSHDREFLDNVVERVVEIDEYSHESRVYDGNFTSYIQERNDRIERQWAEYSDKVEKIEKMKGTVVERLDWMEKINTEIKNNKNLPIHEKEKPVAAYMRDKAGRAGRRARMMKDRLEKFENEDTVEKPKESLPLHVHFEVEKRSGDKVFLVKGVEKDFVNTKLGPIDLEINYGERILILGQNGVGKSTLIKLLLEAIVPTKGEIKKGTGLVVGYLPQGESFAKESTALQEFLKNVDMEEGIARRLLNRYKITATDVHKKIEELSSGERSRLILAILMAKKPNCIILDEPSNHLDLEVLEELEEALREYEGTLIVVSHDRYFIKNIGITKTYMIDREGKLQSIADYEQYEKLVSE